MKIKILGCHGGGGKDRGLTSFLVNEKLCIDAGNITGALDINEQRKIENIIISHTHLDHIRDIPLIADNFIEIPGKMLNIYSHEFAIKALKENFFNNIIFPDFACIPENNPVINYHIVKNKSPFIVNGIKITPIFVNHTVPNMGYILDDGKVAFGFISDTYKTEDIYFEINKNKRIRFVIIEVSFPNELEEIAYLSKHLTPKLLEEELKKIRDDIKIYIYHLKPAYEKKIHEELKLLSTNKEISILEDGLEIEIS